jgi:hypothetical protein
MNKMQSMFGLRIIQLWIKDYQIRSFVKELIQKESCPVSSVISKLIFWFFELRENIFQRACMYNFNAIKFFQY